MKLKYVILEGTPEELKTINLDELFTQKAEETTWLSADEFNQELQKRGHNPRLYPASRKDFCDRFGITYEKRGKEIYYKNDLGKLPAKN